MSRQDALVTADWAEENLDAPGGAVPERARTTCSAQEQDHADVKNDDGSWTEYGSLVGVPIQRGDERG